MFNVRAAPANTFHAWLLTFAAWEFENVDTSKWQTHHRWRVINEMLKDKELRLAEVPSGYELQVPSEEKSSTSEEKASEELLTSGV